MIRGKSNQMTIVNNFKRRRNNNITIVKAKDVR